MMDLRLAMVIISAPFLAASAHAAPTAEQKCQASKNQAAGKYAFCRQKAEKKLVLTGDVSKYTLALATCDTKLDEAWQKAEQKAADDSATCPDVPLSLSLLKTVIGAHSGNVAQALGGNGLRGPGARVKTGQTQCDQGDGSIGACPGSPAGQDGALQLGLPRSFIDNGDGTVTDDQTGLTWEKLADDGSIHDKDTLFNWYDAFDKIATLNTGAFAGHTDWRLPNVNEAQSVGFYGTGFDSVFDNNCVASCTVLTCSCIGDDIWTSTTRVALPSQAYRFTISQTLSVSGDKMIDAFNIRAVRGGQ